MYLQCLRPKRDWRGERDILIRYRPTVPFGGGEGLAEQTHTFNGSFSLSVLYSRVRERGVNCMCYTSLATGPVRERRVIGAEGGKRERFLTSLLSAWCKRGWTGWGAYMISPGACCANMRSGPGKTNGQTTSQLSTLAHFSPSSIMHSTRNIQ